MNKGTPVQLLHGYHDRDGAKCHALRALSCYHHGARVVRQFQDTSVLVADNEGKGCVYRFQRDELKEVS